MNILIIVSVFLPAMKGGGPIQSLNHLLVSEKKNIKIFTSGFDLDGSPLEVQTNRWVCWKKNKNVEIFYSTKKGFYYFSQLWREMKTIKPIMIWLNSFFDPKYSFIPQLLALNFGFLVVISPRGELMKGAFEIKKTKKQLFLTVFKMIDYFSPVRFHFTSEIERQEGIAYLGERDAFVFQNFSRRPLPSADLQSYLVKREQSYELIFLGRLVPKKGLENALQILRLLDLSYSLQMFGEFEDKEYERSIHALVTSLKLSERVVFHGFIPFERCFDRLSNGRLFLSPTKGENFGHSIYECLSIGLPVVISNQTPWDSSIGIRVCGVNDLEAYVEEIKALEGADYRVAAEDALQQAKIYYDGLPEPEKFFYQLCAGVQSIEACDIAIDQKEHM